MKRTIAGALTLLTTVVACNVPGRLRVAEGSTAQNLVFEFSVPGDATPPPLEWIAVEGGPTAPRGKGADAFTYLWYATHVQGAIDPPESTSVRRIRYGVAPAAMASAAAPRPLLPGQYTVRAMANGVTSQTLFNVEADGSVR